MLTREQMKTNLGKMREKLCVYREIKPDFFGKIKHKASSRCKCYYGGDNPGRSQSGSGCPEMLDMVHLLSVMTDREYAYIMKRKAK
jgi:hypothetical protein